MNNKITNYGTQQAFSSGFLVVLGLLLLEAPDNFSKNSIIESLKRCSGAGILTVGIYILSPGFLLYLWS